MHFNPADESITLLLIYVFLSLFLKFLALVLLPLRPSLLQLLPRLVFGNSNGLTVVDYIQKTVVLNLGTVELYGSNDPYQRQPRSPRKTRQPSGGKGRRRHVKDEKFGKISATSLN